ncbi:MAG: ATP-binding protein [Eggerthellaceae bacterium]|nr:ATP-binding protein [Eggerthellaceae bacterium]
MLTWCYVVAMGAVRFAQTRCGKKIDAMHEIDFVVNHGSDKLYIQSAMSIDDPAKREQEIAPLLKSGDYFRKIVVTGGSTLPRVDENGITHVDIIPFLRDETIIG